jgi:hypothetical protein
MRNIFLVLLIVATTAKAEVPITKSKVKVSNAVSAKFTFERMEWISNANMFEVYGSVLNTTHKNIDCGNVIITAYDDAGNFLIRKECPLISVSTVHPGETDFIECPVGVSGAKPPARMEYVVTAYKSLSDE